MTPFLTPLIQIAYDHAKMSLGMVEQILKDEGLDSEGLAARSHLIEATDALGRSLAREAGQKDGWHICENCGECVHEDRGHSPCNGAGQRERGL